MRRTRLCVWMSVVSLIATLGLAAGSGQAQSNLANSSSSSVPRLVKFSGALKDLTGKPLTGPVEINFAIYKEQADAAPLWQETQTLALDEQGRYTVLLGAMQAEGLPLELFASGGARWLAVQATGAEAQPRVLLVSVPYALKAGDAETLSGKPVSDFVLAQQLKEQVQTEVAQQAKKQQDRGQQALAMVLGQGPTPMASQGQTSFACPSGTSGDCVTVTQSSTGRALSAAANSSGEAALVQQSGTGWGLLVTTVSSTAVYGVSTATTGSGYAIRGESASTEGRGILGLATATTGGTIGLWGNAASTGGTGVLGDATATTGTTYGLRGRSYSSSGTGILAYAIATTGTTKGLWAEVYSADGTAAVFQNTASGKLVSGLVGSGTEVFSVAGNGNLLSAGTLSGTQLISSVATGTAPLQANSTTQVTNLNADLLDGLHATSFASQTDLTTEASARQAADTTLQNNLDSEATVRAAADNARAQLHASNTYQSSPTGTLIPQILGPADNSTGAGGFASNPLDLAASAFNTGSSAAEAETFRWQAEPVGDNTATPSATLNLLFGSGTTPAETGLKINADGTINFAVAQTFPAGAAGLGTITAVTAGTGLSGGGTGGSVTLNNTGVLSVGAGTGITSTGGQTPTLGLDTSYTNGLYVQKAGDAMTGTLSLAANGLVAGTSQLVLNNGNVGIGTNVPANTLDVLGGVHVQGGALGTTGEAVLMRDDLDSVHMATGQAGSQMHFRLSRDNALGGYQHFLIGPYKYGMEVDYPGVLEFNTLVLSVKGFSGTPGTGIIYLDTALDSGSLLMRADTTGPTFTAAHYGGTSAGSMTFGVINPTDSFNFGLCTANCASVSTLAPTYSTKVSILGNGSVGIGTAAPLTTLQVVGDIRVGTSGTNGCLQDFSGSAIGGTCSSDARLKTNIQPFGPLLDKLVTLKPVYFHWNAAEHPEYHFGTGRSSGLIAQDVEKVFPEMVATDNHGFKMVNYSELPYLLLAAIRELKTANDGLRAQVEARETQWTERLRAQQVQIQKLTGQVQDLQKVQHQVAWLEARLARVEKPRNQAKQVKRTAPPKVSGTEEVIAKVQF